MGELLLKGIRVLDLTMAYAGPIGTRILVDMGAEVIKIESVQRMDMPVRRISYAENEPGDEPWNRGGYFHRLNVGKYGITLALNDARGADIFKRLVKISDVVVENYTPRVMKNFGLDYESLKEIKPDIIMVSMSAYGQTGPHRDYTGYVISMEAKSGLSSLTGYTDGPPMGSGTGYGDWNLGMYGMAGLLMALNYRQRTGKGQYVDVSGREALIGHIGEAVIDYTMNGRVWSRVGNLHPFMAPHNCYRCKGEDEWIAIAVSTDEEWQSLCEAMGNPAWTTDEKFADSLSRWQNQGELDVLIAEWTRDYGHYEAMHLLQQAGVPAGAVLNVKEVMTDPHLMERGFFEIIEHNTGIGKRPHPKQMATRFSKSQGFTPKAAPFLGEDNERILWGLLGMSKEEIKQLEEEEVIGTAPLSFPAGQERPLPLAAMEKEGVARIDGAYLEHLSSRYNEHLGPDTENSGRELGL